MTHKTTTKRSALSLLACCAFAAGVTIASGARALAQAGDASRTQTKENAAASPHFDGKPYFQKVLNFGTKRMKRYVFPTDLPKSYQKGTMGEWSGLGKLTIDEYTEKRTLGMEGIMLVPVQSMVTVEPSPYAIAHPEYFKGFVDGDFQTLGLYASAAFSRADTDRFPKNIFNMKSLNSISIDSAPAGKKQDAEATIVDFINRFGYIDTLAFTVPLSPESFAKIKRLKSLRSLEMICPVNISATLAPLRGSSALTSLRFSLAKVKDADIEAITQLPHLTKLYLTLEPVAPNFNTKWLSKLSTMKRLKLLVLPVVPYNHENFKLLCSLKQLEFLRFVQDKSWNQFAVYSLQKALPKCKLEALPNNPHTEQLLPRLKLPL